MKAQIGESFKLWKLTRKIKLAGKHFFETAVDILTALLEYWTIISKAQKSKQKHKIHKIFSVVLAVAVVQ